MRAPAFGPVLALAAGVALGPCAAHARDAGPAVDRAQAGALPREDDRQLDDMLAELVASAEIGPDGKVFFNRAPGDRRFLERDSGRYWQISAEGQEVFRSRSLWDRTLEVSGRKAGTEPLHYDSDQFADEPLRIAERTIRLPGSDVDWRFVVARPRDRIDQSSDPSG